MITFGTRLSYAVRCFLAILLHARDPQDIARELIKPTPDAAPFSRKDLPGTPPVRKDDARGEESVDRAVQMLALLQRDGRLIDFLSEDVSPYPDSQLGAAVRTIHASCRQVLDRYLKLEPVITSDEDQPVTVPAGFDPATVKLLGNVVGQPPIKGLLRHRGWRVNGSEVAVAAPGCRARDCCSGRGRDSLSIILALCDHILFLGLHLIV